MSSPFSHEASGRDGFVFTHNIPPFSFGASLSYASCDAKTAARSPQVLDNAMLPDGVEIAIFSDKSCDDGGCGFTRPNNVANRKFFLLFSVFLSS